MHASISIIIINPLFYFVQKEGACQSCGESGESKDLTGCATCTYAFHLKCVLPPRKTFPSDSWSCPECVSYFKTSQLHISQGQFFNVSSVAG